MVMMTSKERKISWKNSPTAYFPNLYFVNMIQAAFMWPAGALELNVNF